MRGFPYATKERFYDLENPLNGLRGINVTAAEQTTISSELSGGQNVYTDIAGGVYNRNGSAIIGGIADVTGSQGGWVFRDNNERQSIVTVILGVLYYYNAPKFVPIPSAPTLNISLPVYGVFYPNVNKFYLTNGTDSPVELDMSTGSLTATSKGSMQKSLYLGYNDNHLYFLNLPGAPNTFGVSDLGAITMNSASVTAANGFILGMANLDLYNAIMVTDQRAYRMTGTISTYDGSGNLVYAPGSFVDYARSRCVAPRSIVMVNNLVYWIGLDDFNNVEFFRTDGQEVSPIGWEKLKFYLRNINAGALSMACVSPYGIYAKFCVPGAGSAFNNEEFLLDTVRSVQYTESGVYGPPTIIWEPIHLPGYSITQYATWRSAGQDYILAFDAQIGVVHQQGLNYYDEIPIVSTFPPAASSPTTGSISVTSSVSLDQPFTVSELDVYPLSIGVNTTAYAGASCTVTFTIQTDLSGNPSGTVLASTTQTITTATLNPVTYGSFSHPVLLQQGYTYHMVVSVSTGTLTVKKVTVATLPVPYKTGSGSTWTPGTGTPILLLTTQQDIDASFVHTTALEQPKYKKRTTRVLVNGISSLGAQMTLGIGQQGRGSVFSTVNFSLSGSTATWGGSAGPTTLVWGTAGDVVTPTNSWGSAVADYQVTIYPSWYTTPSNYVSYQFRSVGQADWRINAYEPLATLIPTTVA